MRSLAGEYMLMGMMLSRFTNEYNAYAAKQLLQYGVSPTQALVLCTLVNDYDGKCTQRELIHALGYSGSVMSGIIKRLVKNGFILKKGSDEDRRENIITATEHTIAMIPQIANTLIECESQAMADLDALEVIRLLETLEKLTKQLCDAT